MYAVLFEFEALNGKLMVCSFNFNDNDPAANWLKNKLVSYMNSNKFSPADSIDANQLDALINSKVIKVAGNNNMAFNPNDKTATRKR